MTEAAEPIGVRVENVLVPFDGSEFAAAALPTARALADRFSAELHTISAAAAGDDFATLSERGSAALGVALGDSHVGVVEGDDAAEVIERRAEELGDCVVCMSTQGRGRVSGAVIGSVARSLLQRSTKPVVALGPAADRPGWRSSKHWPAPLSEPRIVACVDGSATSETVLPVASGWARALGMTLTILTVVEDTPPSIRPDPPTSRYGAAGDPQAYVDELAHRWEAAASTVTGRVVRDPLGPASGIERYLDQQPAGLVALTTHARSGLERLRFGAAAAGIVNASVAPCLVVPLSR